MFRLRDSNIPRCDTYGQVRVLPATGDSDADDVREGLPTSALGVHDDPGRDAEAAGLQRHRRQLLSRGAGAGHPPTHAARRHIQP